ncbi:Fe-S biogenesis protein NfuA [Catenovulum adriaticum]|uniref:Fe/S biogenesis protein NfuA n=1 Tax=Catenovulum adriaticum TaxID=2984846 RepID=A0ABY7ALH4_9ALTE|nr:Fe-S biogenesis protein NfuA [Catenovulum sp. TS8]WAJ70011.1 Fe-S biogenesis protein NfuA [Catenovulum sp. TS8]
MSETQNLVAISETAQLHFANLLEKQDDGTQIRIFVVNPGTPNAECGVSYCPADAIEESDIVMKFEDFNAVVDRDSEPYLEDASIDFVTDQMGSQLTLKAPNAKMRKVSEDASLRERIEYVLVSTINPQLANHGGKVSLIELTDDGVAILEFGGGCNGCSMVDVTLKEGIEKQLIEQFEGELTGVKDVTEHQAGSHSYY